MSSDTLFSAHWHRVKEIRPHLAEDVNIVRQVYRGRPSWILQRRATNSFHRLDIATFELVDRLDGVLSIGEIWELALVKRGEAAPTQDEWLRVLAALQSAELLVVNRRVSAEQLFERRDNGRSRKRRERWQNPLFLRFALHDPDAWLTHLEPLAKALFSRTSFFLWILLLAMGLIALALGGANLAETLTSPAFPSPQMALLMLVIYPPLKLLHELGHALAIKRGGGEVHEVGIVLMVLVPLPYVDASASAAFAHKRDRMLVAAAGIAVELACAAFGAVLWASTSGIVADAGLALLLTGGLSTLLINGNPLLRFDSYYLLADALEIPNLMARSRDAVLAKIRSMLSGEPESTAITEDVAERYWLLSYGVASAVYRTGLMLWIAWWLSGRFLLFGVALALYVVVTSILIPLSKGLGAVVREPSLRAPRGLLVISGLPLLLTAAILWLPLPNSHVTQGVVWLPDEAIVRITSDCVISAKSALPGQQVEPGQPLFNCLDPELAVHERELVARADEISARLAGIGIYDPAEQRRLELDRLANDTALVDVRRRMKGGYHTAAISGRFDIAGDAMLSGRALTRGDIAAYVIPPDLRTVRVALAQHVAGRLDTDLQRIELFVEALSEHGPVYPSSILSRTLRASVNIPSAALGSLGGGDHRVDPEGNGLQLLSPVFNLELAWPEVAGIAPVGTHVAVRFVHTPAPLGGRMADVIRRAFEERDRV